MDEELKKKLQKEAMKLNVFIIVRFPLLLLCDIQYRGASMNPRKRDLRKNLAK